MIVAAPGDATANAVVSLTVHPAERTASYAVGSVDTERTATASAVTVVVPAAAGDVGTVSVFAVPHEWLVVSEAGIRANN